MPRAPEVYSLPAGTTVAPNTTIQSSWANALTADIEQTFNTVQPIVFGGTGTATAGGAADALSPAFVNVASGATTNIGAATSPNVNITGTTTITAFDTVADGIKRFVKFAGALTLTHNATSLILPGGVNITAAAGDTGIFVSEGSGNWRCLSFMRRSSPAYQLLDEDAMTSNSAVAVPSQQSVKAYVDGGQAPSFTSTPSGVASVTFSGLSTSVRTWRLEIVNLRPATDNDNLKLAASASGTPVAINYEGGLVRYDYNSATGVSTNSTTYFPIGATVGNASNEGVSAVVYIQNLGQSGFTFVHGSGSMITPAGTTRLAQIGGALLSATAYSEINIAFAAGNITSGEIRLYPERDS